ALLKHPIPIKTDSWEVKAPGFTEVDLVSHSGDSADGEFAHTLNLTDIHTGWTESRALLGKSEMAVQGTLDEIQRGLPFRLLGVGSDKGSGVFNWRPEAGGGGERILATARRTEKEKTQDHTG